MCETFNWLLSHRLIKINCFLKSKMLTMRRAAEREEGELEGRLTKDINRERGRESKGHSTGVQDMPVYLCQHSGTHSIGRLNASQQYV